MASESSRERLPFEPKRSRKKTTQGAAPAQTNPSPTPKRASNPSERSPQTPPKATTPAKSTVMDTPPAGDRDRPAAAGRGTGPTPRIPDAVSNRMIRRMVIFCGIPSSLGIATFIGSYLVVSHDWFPLPNVAVVIASMGCFGLGVLGLSYGVLSASWDEAVAGSWLGWEEFTTNAGRMVSAWRSARASKD